MVFKNIIENNQGNVHQCFFHKPSLAHLLAPKAFSEELLQDVKTINLNAILQKKTL